MFLNPWLLLGALGIGVPILIHLLNRRRFQRVVWAAMRFVQLSIEKNRRRMLIEDLILLLLRCAIIFLFAIALAAPVLTSRAAFLVGGGRQPVTAVIILDQSGSMGKSDGTQTRFDAARQAADDIVASLPTGSSVAVLLASDTVRDLIPQPTVDLALVRQHLAHATLTDRATDLAPALTRAFAILAPVRAANKHVYLLTDGQAAGWRQGDTPEISSTIVQLLDANRPQVETHLCLISDHDTRNLLVSGLRLTTELPTADKPLHFDATVQNLGPAEARNVTVRLFADSAVTPSDEATIPSIPARSTLSVSLGCRFATDGPAGGGGGAGGYHVLTARIGHDLLPADDERSLVIRVLGQVRVLLVDGESGKQAQEEDTFFVRNALTPVPVEQRPAYFVQTDTIDAPELEHTTLEKYDVIVLANVAEISQSTLATLERVVAQGHGLLVFGGPHLNLDFYRDLLYRQHNLLPAWLSDPHGDAQSDHFETLQSTGFDHPLTIAWNQKPQGDPATARLFRMHDLVVDPTSRPATDSPIGPTAIVARYATGKIAIAEHAFGQGRVLLVGTTANTLWTDLPARGSLFVPLMQRTLDRLVHRQEESLNLTVGQRLILRCPTPVLGKDATITPPPAAQLPPLRTRVEMLDNWPTLTFDATDRTGIYRLAIDGLPPGIPPGIPTSFAVQPNSAESDLEELSSKELDTLQSRATVVHAALGESLKHLSSRNHGLELWRPLITAVLLLVLLETLLAFRFSRPK